jgi:hypothetical protein
MSPLEDWEKNLRTVAAAAKDLDKLRASNLFSHVRSGAPEGGVRGLVGQMSKWDLNAKGLYALFNITAAALGMRYVLTQVSCVDAKLRRAIDYRPANTKAGPTGVCATDKFLKYISGFHGGEVP